MDLITKMAALAAMGLIWMLVNIKTSSRMLKPFSFYAMLACLFGASFYLLVLLGVIPWTA